MGTGREGRANHSIDRAKEQRDGKYPCCGKEQEPPAFLLPAMMQPQTDKDNQRWRIDQRAVKDARKLLDDLDGSKKADHRAEGGADPKPHEPAAIEPKITELEKQDGNEVQESRHAVAKVW